MRAFEYFGGVPRTVVPDQLKSGVEACRYEPAIQRTYAELAQSLRHDDRAGAAGKPRDKAKVEGAVQIAAALDRRPAAQRGALHRSSR